jgi:DnaA family protein
MGQLTTISLLHNDKVSLTNFIGNQNNQVLMTIEHLLEHDDYLIFYFYGESGIGKTHILQSYCSYALELGFSSIYFDCLKTELTQDMVEEFIDYQWVCLDNIHCASKASQYALYTLYNAVRLNKTVLMVSANVIPKHIDITLMDLKTRLSLTHSFALEILDYYQKKQILQQKMNEQNININNQIYDDLLLNYSRNLLTLVNMLFFINQEAIKQNKRVITSKFVKQILESSRLYG